MIFNDPGLAFIFNRKRTFFKKRRKLPDVDVVYLNWEDDPTTTMTIQWHTIRDDNPDSEIQYREEGNSSWDTVSGNSHYAPSTQLKRKIHFCKLDGLKPDTGYEFKIPFEQEEKIRKLKTMPSDLNDREVKIATAGDSHGFGFGGSDYFEDITKMMGSGSFDADMILGAGDYTYDEGLASISNTETWVQFLKTIEESAVSSGGYIPPFLPSIGNHDMDDYEEVDGDPGIREERYMKNYANLFAFPTKEDPPTQKLALGQLKFGDYLQVFLLDTGTEEWGTNDTEQIDFLENNIDNNITHIIPIYHRPMYGYRGNIWSLETVQEMFLETFYENGVNIVSEGHSHRFVATEELAPDEDGHVRLTEENEDGLVLIGEGCWGYDATARSADDDPDDFDKIADIKGEDNDIENARHFWGITLTSDEIKWEAINYEGEVFYSDSKGV